MKKLVRWIIKIVKFRVNVQAELEYERSKVAELELELRHVRSQYHQCSGWLEEERKMEEQLRCQEAAEVEAEACWNEREDARFDAYEHEEWEEEFDDTVENFSEHPSLSAEDDEPLSPEMEYWFTPCDKCGKYTEFCPCDGEFED